MISVAAIKPQAAASGVNSVAEAFTEFKHLLLPITDRNPYLSEGTRQVNYFVYLLPPLVKIKRIST